MKGGYGLTIAAGRLERLLNLNVERRLPGIKPAVN